MPVAGAALDVKCPALGITTGRYFRRQIVWRRTAFIRQQRCPYGNRRSNVRRSAHAAEALFADNDAAAPCAVVVVFRVAVRVRAVSEFSAMSPIRSERNASSWQAFRSAGAKIDRSVSLRTSQGNNLLFGRGTIGVDKVLTADSRTELEPKCMRAWRGC